MGLRGRSHGQHVKIVTIVVILTPEQGTFMKKALITGITGQDGSYLAELLLEKGYEVHGMLGRSSSFNTGRIDHLFNDPNVLNKKLFLHYGDLTDSSNLNRLLEKIHPEEIYNLGAQSHVKVSFEIPEYTAEVDGIGTFKPKREFLNVDDMADACVHIMEKIKANTLYNEMGQTHINIGTGIDLTIRELAEAVKSITRFYGIMEWDIRKPDGTSKKRLDISLLHKLDWKHKIELRDGIESVYKNYCAFD